MGLALPPDPLAATGCLAVLEARSEQERPLGESEPARHDDLLLLE
jgi:hypothetical protein